MTSLQTVVMGLVIVFLDVPPDGFDWVADPIGWLVVLVGLAPLADRLPNHRGVTVTAWVCLAFSVVSWPGGSPATLTPWLGWLFSLPTLAWCFLVCDAVADASRGRRRWWLVALRTVFVVAAVLPGLVHLGDQQSLSGPAEVLVLLANIALVATLWRASGDAEPERTEPAEPAAAEPQVAPTPRGRPRTEPTRSGPVTGAEVLEKVRRRREQREREQGTGEAEDPDEPGA